MEALRCSSRAAQPSLRSTAVSAAARGSAGSGGTAAAAAAAARSPAAAPSQCSGRGTGGGGWALGGPSALEASWRSRTCDSAAWGFSAAETEARRGQGAGTGTRAEALRAQGTGAWPPGVPPSREMGWGVRAGQLQTQPPGSSPCPGMELGRLGSLARPSLLQAPPGRTSKEAPYKEGKLLLCPSHASWARPGPSARPPGGIWVGGDVPGLSLSTSESSSWQATQYSRFCWSWSRMVWGTKEQGGLEAEWRVRPPVSRHPAPPCGPALPRSPGSSLPACGSPGAGTRPSAC